MDIERTQTPWRVVRSSVNSTVVDAAGRIVLSNIWHELAERIALWRNAEDVMMRLCWWPSYEDDGWRLDEPGDVCAELGEWVRDNPQPDPYTAIVEAYAWYKANVEKSGN